MSADRRRGVGVADAMRRAKKRKPNSDSSEKPSVDVLVPTPIAGSVRTEERAVTTTTTSYARREGLYATEVLREVDLSGGADGGGGEGRGAAAAAAWNAFEPYLARSVPAKIVRWPEWMRRGGDVAGSHLDGASGRRLIGSHRSSIERSMPEEALDAAVTVQVKPATASPPCRLCEAGFQGGLGGDATPPFAREERARHEFHVADGRLTVAPYEAGDERNLFLGHEGQITATATLRDVLIERTHSAAGLKVCVAQANIYSREESKASAAVDESGKVAIEGGAVEPSSRAASPLAALLPWIRLPSFLLPTDDGRVVLREINFWACPEEGRTNTHYDGHHNLLMVLRGTKTVELSPPGAFRGSPVHGKHANHPFLLRRAWAGGRLLDDDDVGPSKESSEDNVVLSVTAGEAAFIPEGWWHRVESSDDCVAINVWFDRASSSLSSVANEDNVHQLPFQARDLVRRYVDSNIADVNEARSRRAAGELLASLGFAGGKWNRTPGRPVRELVDAMGSCENEEIVNGIAVIGRYADRVLGTSPNEGGADPDVVRPLRLLAGPLATKHLALMISLFVAKLDPRAPRDRVAMMALLERLPSATARDQRRTFASLVEGMTREACYALSVAWEEHGSPSEAEASYASLFGRCAGDEGRRHFLKEVDAFLDESARRLVLGDLMLLNPRSDGA